MKCRSSNLLHLALFHSSLHQPANAAAPGLNNPKPLLRQNLILAIALLAAVHSGCPQTSPSESTPGIPSFNYIIALRGCTQEDAPALEIYLTPTPYSGIGDPQPPYLRFEISASPTEDLSATTLPLIPLRRDPTKPGRIARAEFATSATNSIWLTGTLTLDHATPGHPISGRYSVTTPSGQHLTSTFQTAYPTKPSVCG